MSRFRAKGLEWGVGLHEADGSGSMLAHLFVATDGFEGGFSARITSAEWHAFAQMLEELGSTSRGEGTWANADANIAFTLRRSGDCVSGTYAFCPGPHGPALTGAFEIDSAGLMGWATHVRRAFPSC